MMPKYKFDKPIPTKSGSDVIEIWKELNEQQENYAKVRYSSDSSLQRISMLLIAKRIRHLQDDIGIKLSQFPELDCFTDSGKM